MPASGVEFRHDAAIIVSMFVESVLYGLFVPLFCVSTYALLHKRRQRKRVGPTHGISSTQESRKIWLNLTISAVMFALATMHVGVNLSRLLEAYVYSPLGVAGYLQASINSPIFAFKNAIYLIQTLVGDGFMIYRLYLIWGSSWKRPALYPIVLAWFATLAAGIGMLRSQAKMPQNLSLYSASLREWLIAVFALTLFTDVACTVLITWRIWIIYHRTKRESLFVAGPSLVPAMVMIIESGALYSLCVTLLLAFYIVDSGAHKILLDAVTQLIGVVFSLIIIRVALDLSPENNSACGPGESYGMHKRCMKTSRSSQGGTLTEMQFDANANPKLRPISPRRSVDDHMIPTKPKESSDRHEYHHSSLSPYPHNYHGEQNASLDRRTPSTMSLSSIDVREMGLENPTLPTSLDLEACRCHVQSGSPIGDQRTRPSS